MVDGRSKGMLWEREFAKKLSLWWTEGRDAYVFSRRGASGAAPRDRFGFSTVSGDIQADKEIGGPLLEVCTIELKHYKDLSAELWKMMAGRKSWLDGFWNQAVRGSLNSGKEVVLVIKADYRPPLVMAESGKVLVGYIKGGGHTVWENRMRALFSMEIWFRSSMIGNSFALDRIEDKLNEVK